MLKLDSIATEAIFNFALGEGVDVSVFAFGMLFVLRKMLLQLDLIDAREVKECMDITHQLDGIGQELTVC